MRSMTGFGRGTAENQTADITFTIEITSINRKQLDIRVALPNELSSFEPGLRSRVGEFVSRGAVNVKVLMQLGPKATKEGVKLNSALLEALIDESRQIGNGLGLTDEIHIRDFMDVPGVIEFSGPNLKVPEVEIAFSEALDIAVNELVAMKEKEGEHICKDIASRLQVLRKLVDEIEPLAADIPEQQKTKLLQKLEHAGLGIIDSDDERILREVVIYCDKADVTEEITRLRSHFVQFEGYLKNTTGPVGRSLDFLIQELFRETTTLGNKAAGCQISPLVVKMKTELEKIREQVQNAE